MIPLTRPWIDDAEVDAVSAVLRSGMLVQGAQVAEFESQVAAATGRAHAVAVANGTSALVLALRALGVGAGDEVLCPALTWPSPAHAILEVGATPVLVDVDPAEWNVTRDALEVAIGPANRAAIAIDQFGAPLRSDIDQLSVPVIEDAACALGAQLGNGRPAGSLGAIATLSFHPRKLLTTGEGGVVLTDDGDHAESLRALRNHGQAAPGRFVTPACNHRLTDLAAALGVAQMARLDETVRRRRAHAATLREALAPTLTFQQPAAGTTPNEQTLGALLRAGVDRAAFIARCRAGGVQVGALSYALSQVETVGAKGPCPVAEDIVARGVALPLFPQMVDAEVAQVARVVQEALG